MKLQNLAIIFSIIVIPIALVLSIVTSNRLTTLKTEISYNTALATATRDGIKALEYNSYDNRFLAIADTIVRDAKATITTFINSLATNLGLGDAGVDILKPYIPAVAYITYDGYYIYTPDVVRVQNPANPTELIDTLEHSLKPYSYYTEQYSRNGNVNSRVVINYTLDNFVKVYIYDESGDQNIPIYNALGQENINGRYEVLVGYIISTDPANGVHISGGTVKYKGIEITDTEAKDFYQKAYDFTKKMQNLNIRVDGKNLFDSDEETSNFNNERIRVIREVVQSSLNSAIGNYNLISQGVGTTYAFQLPVLSGPDWDRALSNVSLITFFQGVGIGEKYYNGYAVSSSFANSYFTPDSELCQADNNRVIHRFDCPYLNMSNIKTSLQFVFNSSISESQITNELTRLGIAPKEPTKIGDQYYLILRDEDEAKEFRDNNILSPTVTRVLDHGKYLDLSNERKSKDGEYEFESCYYCFIDGNYQNVSFSSDVDRARRFYTIYAIEKVNAAKRYNLNY